MKERILKHLEEAYKKSGGHCGTTVPELLQVLEVDYQEIREDLVQLFVEKRITVHPSVHK